MCLENCSHDCCCVCYRVHGNCRRCRYGGPQRPHRYAESRKVVCLDCRAVVGRTGRRSHAGDRIADTPGDSAAVSRWLESGYDFSAVSDEASDGNPSGDAPSGDARQGTDNWRMYRCPRCGSGENLVCAGPDFRPPPQRREKEWARLRAVFDEVGGPLGAALAARRFHFFDNFCKADHESVSGAEIRALVEEHSPARRGARPTKRRPRLGEDFGVPERVRGQPARARAVGRGRAAGRGPTAAEARDAAARAAAVRRRAGGVLLRNAGI